MYHAVRFIVTLLVVQAPQSAPSQTSGVELDRGITVRVFQVAEDLEAIPRLLPGQTPNFDAIAAEIDLREAADFGNISSPTVTLLSGWIEVPTDGIFRFRLTSDDGSRFLLDERPLIDHDGRHGASSRESDPVPLGAGLHSLLIEHFDHGGQRRLTLEWQQDGSSAYTVINQTSLRTEKDLTRVTSPGVKAIDDGRRPGDRKPVAGVHPGWDVATVRPDLFEPMVGAMAFDSLGRLIVGTFDPIQRDDRSLPDIDSKEPDKLYAISGVTKDEAADLTVSVAAEGLYEPCGLCAVGDDLYVSHRREITRLRDTDHDGYYETHETVASGWEGWNYHQFTFGLVHLDGYLYATLSTAMAPPAWEGMGTNAAPNGPMRGGILEIDLSSNHTRVIAGGTRAPNGIGVGPGGTLWYLDNQGAWMPASQLSHIIPGRFYGHFNRTNFVPNLADRFPEGGVASVFCDRPRTNASVLLPHNELSNSPTQPQLITSGPFAGQMFIGELTGGGIRRVCIERVNGQWQGAAFQFTQGLESGVNRLIWGPDGALYAGGIGAGGNWNWRGTRFGLQRLRPNGRNTFEMHSVRAMPDGFEVEFTQPVSTAWLENPSNYTVEQWTYVPTADYGGPKIDLHQLNVTQATPSSDGRRVRLIMAGLKEGYCVHIRTDPTSETGERIWATEAWYTLNQIPAAVRPVPSKIAGISIDPDRHGVGVGVLPPESAVPLIAASADPTFRRAGDLQLPRDGTRSPEELMALPGWVEVAGTGDLVTGSVFGDARLHVEWLSPLGGEGQLAGNSGVYLQDLYEIQVLGTAPGLAPPANNEAGAIYGIKAADVNASTGPGTWQAYDIWFLAPRFVAGQKSEDARMTVYWNGKLIHDDVAVPRPTGSREAGGEPGGNPMQVGPLRLQDHASAAEGSVRFRNVWISPLEDTKYVPGPWENPFGTAEAGELPAGWTVRGGAAEFQLEQGVLTGTTRPNTPNTFLVSTNEYRDFELLVDVQQHPRLNSGVQIRSHFIGGPDIRSSRLQGIQVELDPSDRAYTGGLYDEERRGWLYRLIDAPYARRAYLPGEVNQIRVLARGPVIQTWINGSPAASLFDALDVQGYLGFQVHGVGAEEEPMEVRFANLKVRELTAVPIAIN